MTLITGVVTIAYFVRISMAEGVDTSNGNTRVSGGDMGVSVGCGGYGLVEHAFGGRVRGVACGVRALCAGSAEDVRCVRLLTAGVCPDWV